MGFKKWFKMARSRKEVDNCRAIYSNRLVAPQLQGITRRPARPSVAPLRTSLRRRPLSTDRFTRSTAPPSSSAQRRQKNTTQIENRFENDLEKAYPNADWLLYAEWIWLAVFIYKKRSFLGAFNCMGLFPVCWEQKGVLVWFLCWIWTPHSPSVWWRQHVTMLWLEFWKQSAF